MKDYAWLAVFSVFTLVVGILFTYGNATRADTAEAPIQVFVTSTTSPSSPIIIQSDGGSPEFAPPVITVNVMIATSSFLATPPTASTSHASEKSAARTYYVTNNTYTTEQADTASTTEEESETVTLSIQGIYDAVATPIEAGETLLAFLTRLDAANPDLDLATQDYGDLGILVTGMGGLTNGTDGNYWQYEIDGTVPMVGAAEYELHDGETVVWEFKGF